MLDMCLKRHVRFGTTGWSPLPTLLGQHQNQADCLQTVPEHDGSGAYRRGCARADRNRTVKGRPSARRSATGQRPVFASGLEPLDQYGQRIREGRGAREQPLHQQRPLQGGDDVAGEHRGLRAGPHAAVGLARA